MLDIMYQINRGLRQDSFGSIVVNIPACHAGDRGSIPRRDETPFWLYM